MIDEAGLADPHAHFGDGQFWCGVFYAQDLLVTGRFHRRWRWPAAHNISEFGRRPRHELAVTYAVDQTSAMEDLGKSAVVRIIHEVEISIDRGCNGLDLVHSSLRRRKCEWWLVHRGEPALSAVLKVPYTDAERYRSTVISWMTERHHG